MEHMREQSYECRYSGPSVYAEDGSRTLHGYKFLRCSSPLHTAAQYVHITYICTRAAAGSAYTSLHPHGFSVALGT